MSLTSKRDKPVTRHRLVDLFARHERGERRDTAPLTTHKYAAKREQIRRSWLEFCAEGKITVDPENPFKPAPKVNDILTYLEYECLVSTGSLDKDDDKITVKTLFNKWEVLHRAIKKACGNVYSSEEIEMLKEFIMETLPQLGALSTKRREKPLADLLVIRDLIDFLWRLDEYDFIHPRNKLQLVCGLQLLFLLGLRPGEFVESSAHRGSNQGLYWGDVLFTSQGDENGKPFISVALTLRLRKGQRGNRGSDVEEVFREETKNPDLCLVSSLLALAIADGVLAGVEKPADLATLNYAEYSSKTEIAIKAGKEKIPVLRRCHAGGSGISPTAIMTADRLNEMCAELGERAGYKQKLGAYCMRRGFANKIDKELTTAERNRLMGHTNSRNFDYYMSIKPQRDIQGIMVDRPQEQTWIDYNRSMRSQMDPCTLLPIGSALSHPRYFRGSRGAVSWIEPLPGRKEAAICTSGTTQGNNRPQPFTTIKRPERSDYLATDLRYEASRAAIVAFLRQSDARSIVQAVTLYTAFLDQPERYYPATEQYQGRCLCGQVVEKTEKIGPRLHILSCHLKSKTKLQEDALMAKLFSAGITSCRWKACRFNLSGATFDIFFQHMKQHVQRYRCMWGNCYFNGTDTRDLAEHLLMLHGVPSKYARPCTWFCFRHAEYYSSLEEWRSHCETHLEELNEKRSLPEKRSLEEAAECHRVAKDGVLLAAFHCPFCLGDESQPAEKRYQQFTTLDALRAHLKAHDMDCSVCPHPICRDAKVEHLNMSEHFERFHRIPVEKKSSRSGAHVNGDIVNACKTVLEITELTCKECETSCQDVDSFLKHVRRHGKKICPCCDLTFPSVPAMEAHLRGVHSLARFFCRVNRCHAICKTSQALERHKSRHINGLVCTRGCGAKFVKVARFRQHMQVCRRPRLPSVEIYARDTVMLDSCPDSASYVDSDDEMESD